MRHTGKLRRRHDKYTRCRCIVQDLMSFRPARFTDIQRSGPPTTADGAEWSVRLSAQPPDEWLVLFQADARGEEAASGARWAVNVQFKELRFASSADNIAPRLKEKFNIASADPRCAVNLRPARIFTEVMICPSPKPPTNRHTHPTPMEGAIANPPNPTAPAIKPTSRLRRSLFETVTPPRNAPQNFAIINSPLWASSIPHCRASIGRIGPSSAVPSPASISP